jgi:hypothetical protein
LKPEKTDAVDTLLSMLARVKEENRIETINSSRKKKLL